jgi:hypothetical protein
VDIPRPRTAHAAGVATVGGELHELLTGEVAL